MPTAWKYRQESGWVPGVSHSVVCFGPDGGDCVRGGGRVCGGVFINPVAFVPGGALVATLVLGYFWPKLAMLGVSASLSFGRNRADEDEAVAATR